MSIETNLASNSSAMGVLVILTKAYPVGQTFPDNHIYAIAPLVHDGDINITIQNIPIGLYNVLVYDIERNGLLNTPFTSPAVTTGVIAALGFETGMLDYYIMYIY